MKIYNSGLYNFVTGTDPTLSGEILDNFTTNLMFAYSYRKISSGYAGNCVKLRRSSDNDQQDFGFSSGVLDTASVASWASTDDIYAVTWYDQSDNLNAAQWTAGTQPDFSLDQGDGFPAIVSVQGNNRRLTISGFSTTSGEMSLYLAIKRTGTNIKSAPINFGSATSFIPLFYANANKTYGYYNGGYVKLTSFDNTEIMIATYVVSTAGGNVWSNFTKVLDSGSYNGTILVNAPNICAHNSSWEFDGDIMEVICYDTVHDDTTRHKIQNNMINFYGTI